MGNFLRRVSSGAAVKHSAAFHNATVDAIEATRGRRRAGTSPQAFPAAIHTEIIVRNDTGAARDRFDVVQLSTPIFDPDDNLDEFVNGAALIAIAIEAESTKFAVLQEPIAEGGYGRAVIAGGTVARVNFSSATLADSEYARPGTTAAYFAEAATGPVEILWREATTGEQWAYVRLIGGGCTDRNTIIQLTIAGSPTGGTLDYTQTIAGTPDTVTLNYDDTAAEVETALDGHSEIGAGNVSCSGGPFPDATITVEFTGDLAAINHAIPTLDWSSLTGGTGVFALPSLVQHGHPY